MSLLAWPLAGQRPLFPDLPGRFGTVRPRDVHAGVDFYAEIGQPVVAIADGIVVGVEPFTGNHVPAGGHSPWWRDTWAVIVEDATGVFVYGEVLPSVKPGDCLRAGQTIGTIIPVLRKFKGRPMVMLHMERLVLGSRASIVWWYVGNPMPSALLDPTPLLREAAGSDAIEFDLDLYDGLRFRDPAAPVDIRYDFGRRLARP